MFDFKIHFIFTLSFLITIVLSSPVDVDRDHKRDEQENFYEKDYNDWRYLKRNSVVLTDHRPGSTIPTGTGFHPTSTGWYSTGNGFQPTVTGSYPTGTGTPFSFPVGLQEGQVNQIVSSGMPTGRIRPTDMLASENRDGFLGKVDSKMREKRSFKVEFAKGIMI